MLEDVEEVPSSRRHAINRDLFTWLGLGAASSSSGEAAHTGHAGGNAGVWVSGLCESAHSSFFRCSGSPCSRDSWRFWILTRPKL